MRCQTNTEIYATHSMANYSPVVTIFIHMFIMCIYYLFTFPWCSWFRWLCRMTLPLPSSTMENSSELYSNNLVFAWNLMQITVWLWIISSCLICSSFARLLLQLDTDLMCGLTQSIKIVGIRVISSSFVNLNKPLLPNESTFIIRTWSIRAHSFGFHFLCLFFVFWDVI